jgi:hypothetical protein
MLREGYWGLGNSPLGISVVYHKCGNRENYKPLFAKDHNLIKTRFPL